MQRLKQDVAHVTATVDATITVGAIITVGVTHTTTVTHTMTLIMTVRATLILMIMELAVVVARLVNQNVQTGLALPSRTMAASLLWLLWHCSQITASQIGTEPVILNAWSIVSSRLSGNA